MAGFFDFLTGDIQSAIPAAAPPEPKGDGGDDIASRLKADLQRDFGLSDVQASAFVGNLAHESGGFKSLQEINPTVPGSRGGYGYAQWTGPRRRQFEAWAGENGLDPTSYEANYGFLKHELSSTPEGRVLTNLRQAQDPATATRIVSDEFLRPGVPGMASRQNWTQRIMGGEPIGTLNPSIARAATRGRNPADMPAGNAAEAEGVFPQPQQPIIDPMRNETGLQGRQLQVAAEEQRQGQTPGMPAGGSGFFVPPGGSGSAGASTSNAGPSAGTKVGGLGGLGGFLAQALGAPAPVTFDGSAASLIPKPAIDPWALFGEGARKNQEAQAQYMVQVEHAKALQRAGLSPQQSEGNTPQG